MSQIPNIFISVRGLNFEIPSYTCKSGQDQKHRCHIMLEKLWGKQNSPALLVVMQAGTAPLDVSVVIAQKN